MNNAPRVLVIDDDPDMLVLLSVLLDHLDARVTTASDAAQVEAALQHPIDVVLLDLVMPGDSYSRIVALLAASKPAATLALMSGSDAATLDDERARLASLGLHVAHALQKPVHLYALAVLLEGVGAGQADAIDKSANTA